MSHQSEATAAIDALRKDGLNEVLDEVIRELRQVSTFTFDGHESLETAADLLTWLQDMRLGKVAVERPELLYALHLVTRSGTRHEELNGRSLTLETVRDLLEAKLRIFEHAGNTTFDALLALADAVREARNALPPHVFVYQAIDGAAGRIHHELTTPWVEPDGFGSDASIVRTRIEAIRSGDEALQLFDEMSARLRSLSNTDYTLVSGPRRLLEAGQDTTPEDYFAYLFTEDPEGFLQNTAYDDVTELADILLPTFRGCMRRYHLEGYQVLLPGIAHHEAIRPEHEQAGHRASLRCAHPILGRAHQVVDVRCIVTGASVEAITPENLSYQRQYTTLFAEAVGHCIESGVQLAGVNLGTAAASP